MKEGKRTENVWRELSKMRGVGKEVFPEEVKVGGEIGDKEDAEGRRAEGFFQSRERD